MQGWLKFASIMALLSFLGGLGHARAVGFYTANVETTVKKQMSGDPNYLTVCKLRPTLKEGDEVPVFQDHKQRVISVKVGSTGKFYVIEDEAGALAVYEHQDPEKGTYVVEGRESGKMWSVVRGPFEARSEAESALKAFEGSSK
jgi:hypothetical protein